MRPLLSLVTAGWLLWAAVTAVRRFQRGPAASVYPLIVAHFFLFGLPLVLDVLVGPPGYLQQPGFGAANSDPLTFVVYCAYVSLCPVLWFHGATARGGSAAALALSPSVRRLVDTGCIGLALLPVALVALSPSTESYLTYGIPIQGFLDDAASDWHQFVAAASVLAVLGAAFLLSELRRLTPPRAALLLASIVLSCWVNGKRSIVAIALVVVGYALWSRGMLRGRRLPAAIVCGAVFLFSFSFFYQSSVRYGEAGRSYNDAPSVYESTRIDYFRDDRVKMSLFAELHPLEMRILEHRGQSVLFYATFFVPRSLWPAKPWPYSTYFTSAMLRLYPARPLGWGMTTSWLDEAIADFGWAGMLVAPLSLLLLCRIGDSFRWPAMSMLTSLVAVLLLAVHLVAFMSLFVLWVSLAVLLRVSGSRRTRTAPAEPPPRRPRLSEARS